jgi:hypothetical protein
MFDFLRSSRALPPLSSFSLSTYCVEFGLDRLTLGVDNVRHDVFLSPTLVSATRKIVGGMVQRHVGVDKEKIGRAEKIAWAKEIEAYKQLYREIMRDALNKAKGAREIQIVYLAQAALIKMLLEEVRTQFELLLGRLKKTAQKTDLGLHNDPGDASLLKERVQRIAQDRETVRQRVGLEVCALWAEIESGEITPMRQAIFGPFNPFFLDLLANPLPHLDQSENELFMITEYDMALGRRLEDPDKYDTLLYYIRRLLNYIDLADPSNSRGISVDQREPLPTLGEVEISRTEQESYLRKIEGWILSPENIDLLLNWASTKAEWIEKKKHKISTEQSEGLRERMQDQKKMLSFFYRQFVQNGLIERITATYEMQPEYADYCPPLTPHQIAQYLISPKSRRSIKTRLKRMKDLYGRPFSLAPLNKKIKSLEQMTAAKRKHYLIRFLKAFTRYHRDRHNFETLREAMERINIAVDEKIITLSRENNTLYEFLSSHEHTTEKAPIINHVVIKADVRGSTDITYRMGERSLNPASYFSLNFFDPISAILGEYDALKVFIEGDAIILAIYEHQNTPGNWYSVARACGVALNMLVIIQSINEKNQRNQLPILELGVGISHLNRSPAFLFDGGQRIMISPAINHADRLSACSKLGRTILGENKSPFNLFVFQTLPDNELASTAEDLLVRYNVNGIELNAEGFQKMHDEIDLQPMTGVLPESIDRKYRFYTGKFPTRSGRYQRLVIREANVPIVDPATLKTLRYSSRKYYEVCTHPRIYKLARQMKG